MSDEQQAPCARRAGRRCPDGPFSLDARAWFARGTVAAQPGG